jgi:hypothetical protein
MNNKVCCGLACGAGMGSLLEPFIGTMWAGIAAIFTFIFGFYYGIKK